MWPPRWTGDRGAVQSIRWIGPVRGDEACMHDLQLPFPGLPIYTSMNIEDDCRINQDIVALLRSRIRQVR